MTSLTACSIVVLFAIVSPIASQAPCSCPQQPPVCVSNGLTYQGECQLNCYLQNNPNVGLYVIHKGPCDGSGQAPNYVLQGYPGSNSANPQGYPGPNSVSPQGYLGPNSVYREGYPGSNSVYPQGYSGPNSVYAPGFPGLNLNSKPQVVPGQVLYSDYPQVGRGQAQNPSYLAGNSVYPQGYPEPNSVYPQGFPGLNLNSRPQVVPGQVLYSDYPQVGGGQAQNPSYLAGNSLGLGSKQY